MEKVAAVLCGFRGYGVIVTRSDVIARVNIAVMHPYTILTVPNAKNLTNFVKRVDKRYF